MSESALFSPFSFGAVEASNRVVMAPLTRIRADEDGVPTDIMVEHYSQRAALGMITTEGTWPTREGKTWVGQPGIEGPEHVAGWRRVTDAVHAAGGKIVMQIMHGGRISHPSITGTGRVVGPSALAAPGEIRTPEGKTAHPVAHALDATEIQSTIEGFVQAARNAMEAGMDGIQIHGANGYLIHQFIAAGSNIRSDEYGDSSRNRARLAVEVTTAVAEAIGAAHTGIRLSPQHNIQGATESDDLITETYQHIAEGLAPLGLSHIDVLHPEPAGELVQMIRSRSQVPLIANSGFAVQTTRQEAAQLIDDDVAEGVSVGRAVIANPDLVTRWKQNLDENPPNPGTFYGEGARGYTDYPFLSSVPN